MFCPPTPFVAPRENALRNKTPPLREGQLLALWKGGVIFYPIYKDPPPPIWKNQTPSMAYLKYYTFAKISVIFLCSNRQKSMEVIEWNIYLK